MTEPSLWSFISHASPVVKLVILILLAASMTSWTIIIQRFLYFRQRARSAENFEHYFWSAECDINHLYHQLSQNTAHRSGLSNIFYIGFKEFQRTLQELQYSPKIILESVQRAMRITTSQELTTLEKHLSFLATVGSTSPYVGLFGTVWGIMSSFRALGTATGQATLSIVAPGIAEALIATAIGLFVAIPAVIAYNRLSNDVEHIATHYENFQEELITLFHHQVYKSESVEEAVS